MEVVVNGTLYLKNEYFSHEDSQSLGHKTRYSNSPELRFLNFMIFIWQWTSQLKVYLSIDMDTGETTDNTVMTSDYDRENKRKY